MCSCCLGRLKLYYGGLGQLTESLSVLNLVVDDPQVLVITLLGHTPKLQ